MTCPPPLAHVVAMLVAGVLLQGTSNLYCHSRPLDRNSCLISATSLAPMQKRIRPERKMNYGMTAQGLSAKLISAFFPGSYVSYAIQWLTGSRGA